MHIGTAARTAGMRIDTGNFSQLGASVESELWVTRNFQLPDSFSSECLESSPRPAASGRSGRHGSSNVMVAFPAVPDEDAPVAAWHLAIAQSTGIVSRWLAKLGLEAPEGSHFLYEEDSATLAVRTTAEHLALLEQVFAAYRRKVPQMLVFELEVLEAAATLVRWSLAESQDRKDHSEVFSHLQMLANTGEVRSVRQIRLETRSGQRAVSESDFDEAGGSAGAAAPLSRGARLVVEAEINPEEPDISLKIDFSFLSSTAGTNGNGETAEKVRQLRLVTSTMMGAGTSRLLAVCAPAHGQSGLMQAAFLRAEMVPLLPLENARLADCLERHAAVPPLAAGAGDGAGAKSRMEVRVIRMKPELCPSRTGFSSEALVQTLKYHGVSFPDGARVDHLLPVSILVARNTPRNLDTMQTFLEGTKVQLAKVANLTLEIVEGETSLMRGFMGRSRNVADHRDFWKEVEALATEGRMRLLRTARLEVRHGEKGWFAAGNVSSPGPVSALEMSSGAAARTAPSVVRSGVVNRDGAAKGTRNGIHPPKFAAPARLIGTWLEVAPVISGNSMDVEVEIEHHYIASTEFPARHGVAGYLSEAEHALASYRRFRCSSSLAARPGMVRLVGVWSPEESISDSGRSVMQAAFLRVDLAWARVEERS